MSSSFRLLLKNRATSDGVNQLLNLIQDPFAASFQQNAFWTALGTSIGVSLLIGLAFSFIRPYHNVVYAPKLKHADDKHAPPPLGRGVFSWVKPLYTTKEQEVISKAGLDAAIFLRFTKMLRNLFLIMTIFGCGIMIPINIINNENFESSYSTSISNGNLLLMTPLNVWGTALWSHVVCSWLFDICVMGLLWWNYRSVKRLRKQHFESPEYQRSLHARTLMITEIPKSHRTDEGILRIADEVNPTSGVPRAVIGRNVKELPELIEQHDETVRELEAVLSKYLKKPDNLPATRPTTKVRRGVRKGQQVDAIEFLTEQISQLEARIKDTRETIDKRNAMPYGFASWGRIIDAHAVAFNARRKHPQGTTIVLATRPNDLIWDNLSLTTKNRRWKRFVTGIWVALLTIVWIVPNALIAVFLANLNNLGSVWQAFQTQLNANPKTWAAVQGVLSPAITSLIYLLLPIIFRRLAIRSGDMTKTNREKHVLHQLYAFFVFNNLIVFSLFSAIWQFVSAVINARDNDQDVFEALKDGDIFTKIMTTLCTVSPFWITWLLQRNLGAAADLAQLFGLTRAWFARTFMHPTPRQWIEWTAPPPFDYAPYYNYFLFYATVALCFATLQPIVLPVTALYFSFDSVLKKYILLYVCVTKTESGGQFWRHLFNRMLFAILLANCIVALIITPRATWSMLFALLPLPILILGFKWYCVKTFDAGCKYYNKADIVEDSERTASKGSSKIATRFGHPGLYKPLITPMVHAKAQHVLGQVYRGRLDAGENNGTGYSDVALEQMSQTEPGKAARFASTAPNAPFEIVPESQLDFSYYKNRQEFADDHGGGGIFGKPEDLISDRPSTARTFMGSTNDSPSSSRASSPIPNVPINPYDPAYRDHPALRDMNSPYGDLGVSRTGYNQANDSTSDDAALLTSAQAMPETTAGEQISMNRWRPGRPGYGPVGQDDPMSYDYFRSARH
ncbi:MAG: hypothetical protein M1834_002110 [Cirrosporium novae-zelandiae]|nr:MAG: hypothetical protein M1834_002110 [Cirrosporium novae-zelandiae]